MPMLDGIGRHGCRKGRLVLAILLNGASAAVAALVLVSPAWAEAWNGTCEVRFQGTSNLHDFTGKARCQPFRLSAEPAAGGMTIIPGAEVAVPAGEMDTGNRTRDRQMRDMLQSDRFPAIRATFGAIDPEIVRQKLRRAPEAKVPIDFTLTIRDVARPVHAVAGNFRETGARVSFDVEYAVSLKEFRLPPPRALFGLVRVGDNVLVTTAVRLDASAPK